MPAFDRYSEAAAMSPKDLAPTDLANALARPGRASIPYADSFNPDRPLVLECFRPPRHDPDKPVVIVQHGIFEAVGAANSGWYTLPSLDLPYPDGLGGIGLTDAEIVRFLGYPLVIFSGDQDIDGTTENFPKHESAMAQGPNRFARAQFYLDRGRAEAAKLGVRCRWSRVVVPRVAHEGMRMSAFAGN